MFFQMLFRVYGGQYLRLPLWDMGDIYPLTVAGKIFSAIIALLGIGLVAVPTGIISAGFMENIEDNNKQLTEDNIAKIREILEKYDSKNL